MAQYTKAATGRKKVSVAAVGVPAGVVHVAPPTLEERCEWYVRGMANRSLRALAEYRKVAGYLAQDCERIAQRAALGHLPMPYDAPTATRLEEAVADYRRALEAFHESLDVAPTWMVDVGRGLASAFVWSRR